MILSDKKIRKLLQKKELVIKNKTARAIQPCSIDLTLGKKALLLKYWNTNGVLTFDTPVEYQTISSKKIIVPPHSFILATTNEYIELPNDIVAFVEGRSSIGRMGLFIQNASVVVPGFKGTLTLELYNSNILPIELQAGRKICQLVFFQMDEATDKPYKGKYQGQKKATPTKAFLDK